MKKIIYKFILIFLLIILSSIIYLSTIGIQTDRFNSEISNQIKKIDKNLVIKIKKVSIVLNPFKFQVNAKTLGTNLEYKNKTIQIENTKLNISLKSLLNDEFSLLGIEISTKSINIKDLISFIRLVRNDPKLYIAEQFVKSGYLIADIKLEFDELGNIKNNYDISGFVKDGKINLLKNYNLDKIDFIFGIKNENFNINDLKLSLNKKELLIPKILIKKELNDFSISGTIKNKSIFLDNDYINNFIDVDLLGFDIKEIGFISNNNFNFKLNKNFNINNLNISSNIDLVSLKFENIFDLKKIFPKIKKNIIFKNHQITLNYSKDNLDILGSGDAIFQDELDKIEYRINKNGDIIDFDTKLIVINNLFKLDFLNYEKNKGINLEVNIKGKKKVNKNLLLEEISLVEKNNNIYIKKISLSNDYKINNIENVILDFKDKENLTNKIEIIRKDKNYIIKGDSFNINKIIKDLLNSDEKKNLDLFNNNFKLYIDVKKIYLDNKNFINNLKGYLLLKDNKISQVNLESKFSNKKNIKFTITTNGDEQITTLNSKEARPLVERYKFIKGFEDGVLDFYSIKKKGASNSTLKIDNFKIQEIPVLAKLLTLASLQGIADLLTGEGIRFTDFEMKFSSKGKLMTIEEMYAIGPAISILMDGYVESNKLISLRGTLVPATTVNRTISSIPIIGDILVGKKVGEGVFGVSFKIKGPPKNLETTVNPIKTLTPRFITRTLEKIKKN
ncbi:AsmA-like C-terminal region-containing protein [Candidatus Pelagibacter sp.]|jgi:hypothetical protein|nr:AsmA-like C-terminal region-containing protein [Candidatus Pelagibacter sp.]